MGKGAAFDEAIGDFSVAYSNQTYEDWRGFLAAVDQGRIVARPAPEGS